MEKAAREIEDGELKEKIQQIFTENKGRYGSPRIFMALKKLGYNIGKKRIERLYRQLNLVARVMRVTKRTLQNAIKKRNPLGDLMLHTDRGIEYRGQVYQKALKRRDIVHSLSRAGKCTDNAHMESFSIR